MALLACGAALAQSPTYKVGRPPTEEEVRAWDHTVGSDGKELPAGSGSAVEGAKIYAAKCSMCHGKNGEGMYPYNRLVGGVDTLNTPNPIITPGSYWPHPTTLWDFINRAMPEGAAGTLSPNEIYALTAFIFFRNGIIKETDVMDKNTLLNVQMPNRNGFFPNPPQSAPDKDHSWLPYWNQAKPTAKATPATTAKSAAKPAAK
jgi:mono/diheme cytochrome c family protein